MCWWTTAGFIHLISWSKPPIKISLKFDYRILEIWHVLLESKLRYRCSSSLTSVLMLHSDLLSGMCKFLFWLLIVPFFVQIRWCTNRGVEGLKFLPQLWSIMGEKIILNRDYNVPKLDFIALNDCSWINWQSWGEKILTSITLWKLLWDQKFLLRQRWAPFGLLNNTAHKPHKWSFWSLFSRCGCDVTFVCLCSCNPLSMG